MKLMVCTDGSALSKEALLKGLELMNKQTDVLYVVSAVEKLQHTDMAVSMLENVDQTLSFNMDATNEAMEERARRVVDTYSERAKELGAKQVIAQIIIGHDVKDQVVQWSVDHHIDMVIVGNRGSSMMTRMFLGSFSTYLVNHCHCNVVVVKRPVQVTEDSQGK